MRGNCSFLFEESAGKKQENISYQGRHELKGPCWIHNKRWNHRNYYGADCPADDESSKSGRDDISKAVSNRAAVTFYARIWWNSYLPSYRGSNNILHLVVKKVNARSK